MSRTSWFVNQMDREHKAGRDPHAWLATACARFADTAPNFVKTCNQEFAYRLATRAKKAERDLKASNTHCQICERPILSNTGLVAHHGYQRPGYGHQTQSCFGARHLPYEQSRELLPEYIKMGQNYAEAQDGIAASLHLAPPASYTVYPHRNRATGRTDLSRPVLIERPADFDPATAFTRDTTQRNKYEKLWVAAVDTARQNGVWARTEIARCEQRYAAWVPPKEQP